MKVRYWAGDVVRGVAEFFEDQWFDRTRNVRTSGNLSLGDSGLAASGDSEWYQPARPAHIRRALRELSVRDLSGYSYVDLGSGKGRSLFVAAELPFRQITGVELSRRLHEVACANIGRFRYRTQGCTDLRSRNENASEFVFPEGKLVLYLFNPFGAGTMRQVLGNLETSLTRNPRHVVVVLLWPRCEDQVAAMEGMHLLRKRKEYQIFEAHAPGGA